MRHLHLIVDHEPAPTDFPPTWMEFEAARGRFLAQLAASSAGAGDADLVQAEPPEEPASP
jgi:hypothetical protein